MFQFIQIFTPFLCKNPSLFKIFFHYPISIYANKIFFLSDSGLSKQVFRV